MVSDVVLVWLLALEERLFSHVYGVGPISLFHIFHYVH